MKIKEIILENTNSNYFEYARQAAEKFGVPFSVVVHAMQKETGHLGDNWAKRAAAVSKRGAGGVMQLMPDTAEWLGVKDRFDPRQNIQGGVKYLSQLYNKYGGDAQLALAAYNAGPGRVDRLVKKYGDDYTKKLPKETRKYVVGYNPQIDQAEVPDPYATPASKNPVRDVATNVLAAVTGSKNAYGSDQPPRGTTADVPLQPQQQQRITPAPVVPDTIDLPAVEPTIPTPSDYTIRRGDTLSAIAKRNNQTIDQIMAANPHIKDPNKIASGASLKINPLK